ncbi:low temperature requirement protein A [Phenylobacterium sp.]|uniref:low temperature requirement protein A n=1 Tax=Phenylobacterium sp. TaxID=1871053 RepID=UPI002732B391|nr:low temperature requirement protein A [Phenylobacterium sp.]MDP3659785.1 low temperature requirement protein A [Phenylobacterium sp.]
MSHGLLRKRQAGAHARVSFVELFFDLVFVFAITQLSHTLLAHLTWTGVLQAGVLLLAVWWAWVYTTWVTNWLDPEHPSVRLMLFALMGVGLVLSTSLPSAFSGHARSFALAYVTIQIGRSLFVLYAARGYATLTHNFQRIVAWLSASAALWIAGAFAAPDLRMAWWIAALGIECLGPAAAYWIPGLGRTPTHDWNVEGAHIAERCGLFVIIALGESVLVTGATFAGVDWTPEIVAAFFVAFIGTLAMWWIYFSAHAEAASHAIASSDDPGRIARLAYTYIHIPIVAGIIVAAAGDELSLAHPMAAASPAVSAVLLGGPALFLLGTLLFKASVFRVWATPRLVGLGLLALLVPFAATGPATLALAAAACGALVVVGAWESVIRLREGGPALPHKAPVTQA